MSIKTAGYKLIAWSFIISILFMPLGFIILVLADILKELETQNEEE